MRYQEIQLNKAELEAKTPEGSSASNGKHTLNNDRKKMRQGESET